MKRNIILGFILTFVLPIMALAQSPEGRLPKTVVADVLAQMPAENADIYNRMMADLIRSGSEGITILTAMMQPDVDNTAVSYAIGGLAYYVTTPGREADRAAVAKVIAEALNKASDREVKAFFIRQLQVVGEDDAVEVLKPYIKCPSLGEDALMALTEIDSPAAKAAIESMIQDVTDKKIAAKVIGDNGLVSKEDMLLSWVVFPDPAVRRSALNALAKVGTVKSLPALRKAADEKDYDYGLRGATEAYLTLLSRLPLSESGKDLNSLLKGNNYIVSAAAIEIIAAKEGEAVAGKVLKAMSSPDRKMRNAALAATKGIVFKNYYEAGFYKSLASMLGKTKDNAVKVDIMNYLGEMGVVTAAEAITPFIGSADPEVRQAAMGAINRLGNSAGMNAMIAIFNGDDEAAIADAAAFLRWNPILPASALVDALPLASEAGKVAVIELLAEKRASESADAVLALAVGDGKVSSAAYKALANVCSEKQLDKLCGMLQADKGAYKADLQRAIGSVLATMPADKALANVSAKMKDKEDLYYPTLSYVATPAALSMVKNGVAAGSKGAVEAIIAWPCPAAIEIIYGVFADKNLAGYHNAALSSYVALVGKSDGTQVQRFLDLRRALDIASSADQRNVLLAEMGKLDVFNALLLAGSYLDIAETEQAAGTAVMNIAIRNKDYSFYGPEVEKILKKFLVVRKGGDAPYDKEAISKYLAEAPNASKGFVKIFNQKDLTGWKGLVKDPIARAKMTPTELAKAQVEADKEMSTGWEVKDGVLYFTGHGNNLCTDKKYGDIEMYVDWKLIYDGTEKKREGDAGIYLRGAPQVQVWDTCRVDVGAQVGSGGLYNNLKNSSKPLVLADNAIGDWNTFYIKMVGERVTVCLNGQLVVDNVILENYWDRSIPIFTEEQLELQAHGTLVGYRDIYVKELPKVELFRLSAEEQKEGFKVLFDGVSMHEWVGNTRDYVAENGAIALYPGNGGGGNLYTKDEYADYIFRFDFMLTPAANNGLGIRTPMEGDAAYVGTELQILDSEHPVYKDLEIYQYHGSAYGIIPAKRGFLKPTGEWNTQEVIVKGDNVKVTLNGTVILDGNLAEASKNGTMDGKDHPGLQNKKGHIAFLGHGSEVKFRNIRIKELK